MRAMSVKRRKEQPARREVVRQALERDDHRCQFWKHYDATGWPDGAPAVPLNCGGPMDCHEVVPRSAWRAGYLELSNTVTLCRTHHDFVGDNPTHAHTMGLHKFSYERPDTLIKSQVVEDTTETGEAA